MTDLRVELEDICGRLGFTETPEILEALVTPVLRGHHIGLLAGEGSGKGALIGLAALQHCDVETEGIQALILVPDSGHGRRVAMAIHRVAGPDGVRVAQANSTAPDSSPAVLVGRPSELLPDIRAGRLSIGEVGLLVMDGVAQMQDLDEWESVIPIVESLAKDCRKIAISDRPDVQFSAFLDRQLPRARRWPEEILPVVKDPGAEVTPQPDGPIVMAALVPRSLFPVALAECLDRATQRGCGRLDVLCGSDSLAAAVAADLAVSGSAATAEGALVRTHISDDGQVATVHLGLPFTLADLAPALDGDGPSFVIAEPRHGPQLDLLLRRAGRKLGHLPVSAPTSDRDPIQRYRSWLTDETSRGDLLSEMLVLEPLFEELGAVRVAAALSRTLRRRQEQSDIVRPWADVEEVLDERATQAAEVTALPPVGVRPAWTRLYFGVGKRDEAKPGDLVGAITGEAGIAGAQVGKVEIMANFSLVDIDSQVADDVIARLDGALIRGREVPVRLDRNI